MAFCSPSIPLPWPRAGFPLSLAGCTWTTPGVRRILVIGLTHMRTVLGRNTYLVDSEVVQQRCHFANKGPSSQGYSFSSSHVWMWELDHKEVWVLKNRWFWTVVLEKTLETPLYCKEIKPVHPKGNQPWIFIGRTVAEAEVPILWLPKAKNQITGERPWCWERLKAGREGDDRGWDGWMASPIQWTRFWANSGK